MSYIDDIIAKINRINEKSERGDINWTKVNPTTFQWIKVEMSPGLLDQAQAAALPPGRRGPATRVTLQKVIGRPSDLQSLIRGEKDYIFQIIQLPENNMIVSIDSGQHSSPIVKEGLDNLYNTIEDMFDKKTLDYFDELLK